MKKSTLPTFLLALGSSLSPAAGEVIEDNSFFIEEAYNQGPRVVQHISTLLLPEDSDDGWAFGFTQEWPLGSQTHQLSYSLSYLDTGAADHREVGLGDSLLNYRYQVAMPEGTAFAPRLSLVLPTGDEQEGLGTGSPGLQVNLPLSHRLAESWVFHANAGATWLKSVEAPTPGQHERDLTSPFVGASLIWLGRPRLNVLLEALSTHQASFDDRGEIERSWTTVLSPGLRWAIDRGDLQIVPGVALPVSLEGGESSVGMLLYLSFEHPF